MRFDSYRWRKRKKWAEGGGEGGELGNEGNNCAFSQLIFRHEGSGVNSSRHRFSLGICGGFNGGIRGVSVLERFFAELERVNKSLYLDLESPQKTKTNVRPRINAY